MSVTLRQRKNADGTISLRLDIYHNGKRWVETLKNLKLEKPSNVLDRENNKQKKQQAEAIAVARAAELEANDYNIISENGKKTVVIEWLQSFVDNYNKKDKRNMQGALNRFKDYLQEKRQTQLQFKNLSPSIIEDFISYLEEKSVGEGASSYFKRFKKMINRAYKQGLMRNNVFDKVERKVKGTAKKKDILTLLELKTLSATPTESNEIKTAFLFCSVTGLRWCDIKTLTWDNVNVNEKILSIRQSKTEKDVSIPLNDTAIKLLNNANKERILVFDLPTANGANKTLKAWVKRAKINKTITWHNARHSFGTNLIYNDVDVLTASKLLGHTSLKHTQRYVDTASQMKQKATQKINIDL